nr:hypothetical protein [Candidatus Sigynarchaeota archaeon]
MDTWITTFKEYVEEFIAFFNTQTVPVQVLLIAIIVLCFVGAGFVIYGAIWLAYQAIKISIVGTIILVYFLVATIILFIMAFIDPARAKVISAHAGDDIEWFWLKAYPPKNGILPPRHAREEATIKKMEKCSSREVGLPGSHFCSNCGIRFSDAMEKALKTRGRCHCETCGHGFFVQNAITLENPRA